MGCNGNLFNEKDVVVLQTARKLTNPDVITAVRHGLPLPKGTGGFTMGQLNTIHRFITVLERKEGKTLHGHVCWNRPAIEVIYNWCVAYRGHWDDLGSYQRFLEKLEKLQPPSICAIEDYPTFFATVFYEVKRNVECGVDS